jgi:D-inositol-3-phosphate glycosyltransferase
VRSVNKSVEVRRIALVTLHTCPLDRPGAGDAGGMNVYIDQTAQRLADSGIDVHVFTRATFGQHTEKVEISQNYTVHHIPTSMGADLRKEDLPSEVDEFAEGVRSYCLEADLDFDLIHSHYWLSGIAAEKLSQAWAIPFVHTMHTMAKVKNLHLADGDFLEPEIRIKGEEFLVSTAHRLIVNTHREAAELIELYDAAESKLKVVYPGVDLETFSVADGRSAARKRHGIPTDALVLLFVGRLQPLKAPDALLRAAAHLVDHRPDLRERLQIMVCGGPSGTGTGAGTPESLVQISEMLRIGDRLKLIPPTPAEALADLYRMADVVAVPSHSESFGLVALEAQACGTPVVASAVGGLVTAVKDGQSGVLVSSREDHAWAVAIEKLLVDRDYHDRLAAGALAHARSFSWDRTTQGLQKAYTEALLNFPKTTKQKETGHQAG